MARIVTASQALAQRPTLHLSGAKLRTAMTALIHAAEAVGGVEQFVAALKIKSQAFQERFANGKAANLDRAAFDEIVQLMPTVRRRIGAVIDRRGWPHVRSAIVALLHDAHIPGTADARIAAFEVALHAHDVRCGSHAAPGAQTLDPPWPRDAEVQLAAEEREGQQSLHRDATAPRTSDRFHRDLAAEILHNVLPEHHPLLTRWMWDTKANTGVIREIWHDPASGDDTDHIVIAVADNHETFLVLREELSQFLSDQGIFRDMLWYIDVLAAHIYAGYINSQGGAWLKTEFASEGDPLEHTRRILGLDARGTGLRATRPRSSGDAVATDPLTVRGLPPPPR